MKTATPLEVVMIATVRANDTFGRGTCSYIDETFTDDELLQLLRDRSAKDPGGAIRVAKEYEEIRGMATKDVEGEAV